MSAPLNLLVNGARGRMGRAVVECARRNPETEVVAATDVGDDLAAAVDSAQAVVDFTQPSVTPRLAALCAAGSKTLVIGTTGHSDDEAAAIREAAAAIPVVFAPNFSIGVNTLFWLVAGAAATLGAGFDIEVVEMHHRHKKDAPSGTARKLAEILATARQLAPEQDVRHGRSGLTGERPANEIGMHALRGGDVVGDHTVVFAADGERVELSHRASSRDTFANGSLRAALWAHGRGPGLYDMQDVLGLK